MKQNTITALKKVVEEMVSKEVAKQIKYVIDEMKNPTVSEADAADHYTGPESENKIQIKDPVLNKILNETQGGIPQDGSQSRPGFEEYPTMGGGVTDTQEKFFQQSGTAPVGTVSAVEGQPDFMKKAMSGHFKKVIDKVEEKRGARNK
jgi:hypothetical protein